MGLIRVATGSLERMPHARYVGEKKHVAEIKAPCLLRRPRECLASPCRPPVLAKGVVLDPDARDVEALAKQLVTPVRRVAIGVGVTRHQPLLQ